MMAASMRTLRALSTWTILALFAAASASACSGKDDKSLGSSGGTGGGAGSGTGKGGTSPLSLTGGTGSSTGGTDAAGADSGSGASAAENGTCSSVAGLGPCGGTHLQAELRTVNMLLVIDKSGSMDDEPKGFGQKKWAAMKTALGAALEKVETQMNLGLILYPYNAIQPIPLECLDADCCSVATGSDAIRVSIAPGPSSVPQIESALQMSEAGGGTPTAAALAAALDYFTNGGGSTLEGDNYVLLATDGGPDCNDQLTCLADTCTANLDGHCDNGNCCDETTTRIQCLDADSVTTQIKNLADKHISTFVVGIPGTEAYATYLDDFADVGGVPAQGSDHKYYAVSADQGAQGLVDVFNTITTQLLRSCAIALPEQPSKLDMVNVAIDCDLVPQNTDDSKSGWDFDTTPDPSAVVLHGPVCQALEENGAKRVDVVFGCPTVR
jgi:hypothetical protein